MSHFFCVLALTLVKQPLKEDPVMGTIHKKPAAYISRTTLAIFAIPLLVAFVSIQKPPEEQIDGEVKYTDVRIVRLDHSLPHSKNNFVRRVTIHSDSRYPTLWCKMDHPNAMPCPRSLEGQIQGQPRDQLMTHFGIPLL